MKKSPAKAPALATALALISLALTFLPVITSSPPSALAASGSIEALVDDDQNPDTPAVREFAGASRYETSLTTAQQYVDTARAEGTPATTAIIASGESLIDAAAAAGLARATNAPVLLTPSDELFIPAAHLIEGAGITRVLVMGGTAAVSQRVSNALAAVPGVQTVTRIGGQNRFETASLIAAEMRSQAQYCNSSGKAALLVAGDADSFADVTIAGPISYAMGIPILLTSTTKVPPETISILGSLEIVHVVVVGTQIAPEAELAAIGISSVSYITGENQFATAVAAVNELQRCLGAAFSEDSVALISETALPDGISAAPMLAQGLLGDGKLTPVLLVSADTFPAETKNYLLDTQVPVEITTIGGENAVSSEVADAAVTAANGLDAGLPSTDTQFSSGDPAACRLIGFNDPAHAPDGHVHNEVSVGFPLPVWAANTTGAFRVAVLYVDFPDAPAFHTTRAEGSAQLRQVENYLEAASYGKVDVQFTQHPVWLRAENNWQTYADGTAIGVESLTPHKLMPEAIRLARAEFDFSDSYDSLMVVAPSTYFGGGAANTHYGLVPENSELILFAISNSQPFGQQLPEPMVWWDTAAHELVHNLGLADLYPFDNSVRNTPTSNRLSRAWTTIETGLMGLQGHLLVDTSDRRFYSTHSFPRGWVSTSPNTVARNTRLLEMLAWSRWQLDWIEEDQVACLTEPTLDETVALSPVAVPSGVKMVMIPISETSGVVIESRRSVGYDQDYERSFPCCNNSGTGTVTTPGLIEEGVLIYTVDAALGTGKLPLALWAESSNRVGRLSSYPVFTIGSSATAEFTDGTVLKISVESDDGNAHVVRVTLS